MKIIQCEQGTPAWHQVRIGIPTASEFDKILTPTGKASTQADTYSKKLLAEWLAGKPLYQYESEWMKRVKETEQEARDYYAFATDAEIAQVGFVTLDDGSAGCSPDMLVGDRGAGEIKCPAPWTHVGYLMGDKVDIKYWPQVQGQMWIAERDWVDWISYHPDLPPIIVRVQRDDGYIKALAAVISEFNDKLAARKLLLAKYKEAA